MFIVKHRIIFFAISIVLVVASIIPIALYGLKLGTDFRGGTILEVAYPGQVPAKAEIQSRLASVGIESPTIQTAGESGYSISMKPLTEDERVRVVQALEPAAGSSTAQVVQVKRFSSIGPSVGAELAQKGLTAIALVAFLTILYIAFAFRKVSRPVASWKYGVIAIIALIHDITIPTGVFAYLGHTRGTEIDALFITALLTILGLSVSDTIVVFDRIRENIKNKIAGSFEETVGRSLDETVIRSLITSLTVIFVLAVLFLTGASTTKDFALVLMLGMFFGTYSSIFIASPLLVTAYNLQEKKK